MLVSGSANSSPCCPEFGGQSSVITIEQPELHIHPKLQADLGDLLIDSIQEPRRNQFIIETHSEHLALRLQRRVREKKLSPEDISVVYVSRGRTGRPCCRFDSMMRATSWTISRWLLPRKAP